MLTSILEETIVTGNWQAVEKAGKGVTVYEYQLPLIRIRKKDSVFFGNTLLSVLAWCHANFLLKLGRQIFAMAIACFVGNVHN